MPCEVEAASLSHFALGFGMEARWPVDPTDTILLVEREDDLYLPGR